MLNKIQIVLQYLLPKRWLTKLVGWFADRKFGWFTTLIIKAFILYYKVNMQEVKESNITSYNTLNSFFVRLLREDSRPIDANSTTIVFPADGIISQFGLIKDNQIFQAKGYYYSLEMLLANNKPMINKFYNGSFVTIYLSPGDYHRIHMPCNGILSEMLFVPGNLFSVNLLSVTNIPNLFARNERVICLFNTDFGPIAQILVGAIIVGSIEIVWMDTVIPIKNKDIQHWFYPQINSKINTVLLKGQEMGRFKLGSTVINLFPNKKVLLNEHLSIGDVTRIGQKLAYGIVKNNKPLS